MTACHDLSLVSTSSRLPVHTVIQCTQQHIGIVFSLPSIGMSCSCILQSRELLLWDEVDMVLRTPQQQKKLLEPASIDDMRRAY